MTTKGPFQPSASYSFIINEYMIIKDMYASPSDKEASFQTAKLLRLRLLDWAGQLPPELVLSPTCLPVALNIQ